MKKAIVFLMLALLIVSAVYADARAKVNERLEKARKLDSLAEKFKAETGFTGRVDRAYQRNCLSHFRGSFPGISFPDLADTLATRQAFDSIIGKIMPYIGFEGLNLTKAWIVHDKNHTSTIYQQLVHGYSFIAGGNIIVSYYRDSNDIAIDPSIEYKPIPPVQVNYTFEQAVETARQHYINVLGYPDTMSFVIAKGDSEEDGPSMRQSEVRNNGIKYVSDKGEYRLCHIIGISVSYGPARQRAAYIDAQTGELVQLSDDSGFRQPQ